MRLLDYVITLFSFVKQSQKRKLIKEALKLKGKTGIEIGGPTAFFGLRGGFPVYPFARCIDGVNFSTETIWEGKIKQGKSYRYYESQTGLQYIAEASELAGVDEKSYDFLLSSHCLEHVANPIKALLEWRRVLKSHGRLILILPDKTNTFDYRRPYTTLAHMISDYEQNVREADTTHIAEIVQTHDPTKTGYTDAEFKALLSQNIHNRIAHHHVFSQESIRQLLAYCGFNVRCQFTAPPFHLIAIADKIEHR